MLTQGNARLAVGLLDALGINQAIVVGHSQGALVAMEMYLRSACLVFMHDTAPCCVHYILISSLSQHHAAT